MTSELTNHRTSTTTSTTGAPPAARRHEPGDRPVTRAHVPQIPDVPHVPHVPHAEEVLMSPIRSQRHVEPPDVAEPRPPDSPPAGRVDPDSFGAPRRLVARCADGHGTLTGLFFSDHLADIARAKAMCGRCELAASCLAGALEREEPWGVWGGELLSGGRVIAAKRPCGRPPKRPRPEIVYDELGPVEVVA